MFELRNRLNRQHLILVTGANGFIGKNLVVRLKELPNIQVITFVRGDDLNFLVESAKKADAIFHLAGINRSDDVGEYLAVNVDLTQTLCDAVRQSGRKIPIILTSSTQAVYDNVYGRSKLRSESLLRSLAQDTGCGAHIYRLPGVFGKWSRPNYNSVVATFCHNISRGLPIQITNPDSIVELVYIDDVMDEFIGILGCDREGIFDRRIEKSYFINLHSLAQQIYAFKESRHSLITECVGSGLVRALYSTYISHLPLDQFLYDLPQHGDGRGVFVEMLKTPNCGQISFFTVHPGITRGSHYHHTKTEKFLIVSGIAQMQFRHLITNETHQIVVRAKKPQVVDSIPGWVHDITNIGDEDAIIMLWANEIFDRQNPDCIPCEV